MEILDLKSPSFQDDPYPELKRVREAGPLCRVEPYGFLGVTRYDDVHAIMKNPKLFSSQDWDQAYPPLEGADERLLGGRILIGSDPPEHTRIRRLVQRAFTLQSMASWEPKIEAIAKSLFDALETKSSFDLMNDLAVPLPVTVIATMLGVDSSDMKGFKRWSDDMVSVRSVGVSPKNEWRRERERAIYQSEKEFFYYFDRIIAERHRDSSGDDLISLIIRAGEEEQIIRPEEVIALTRILLVAGNETTTNLIGSAMWALLNNPEQWEDLKKNIDLVPNAVEEALRFCGPAIYLTRRTTADTEIAGEKIAAGTFIAAFISSGNHDPAKFPHPEKFDIRRSTEGNMGFGGGIHLCVGAPLARMETRIALREMATRFGDVQLANAKPEWLDNISPRGLKTLPLVRARKIQSRSEQRQGDTLVL